MNPATVDERRRRAAPRRPACCWAWRCVIYVAFIADVGPGTRTHERSGAPTAACRQPLADLQLFGFAACAFGFGFALVPLYDVLCSVTGIGDQKLLLKASAAPLQRAGSTVARAAATTAERWVTVEFIGRLPSVGNWQFKPVRAGLRVHPGQLYEAHFVARNLTGHDTVAQAVPDITSGTGQRLVPQDRVLLLHAAVLPQGRGARACRCASSSTRHLPESVDRLTLSYTFYDESTRVAAR